MVIERGEIWWVDLPEPKGSMPGFRRPVVIIQSNKFNQSNLATVVAVVITSNLRLAEMPGNVQLSSKNSGLKVDSVVNVTQIVTANRSDLIEMSGVLSQGTIDKIDKGIRLVLSL